MSEAHDDTAAKEQRNAPGSPPPPSTASMREIYDWAKNQFTPEDLLKFLTTDSWEDAEDVLEELEAINAEERGRKQP